jgi:hypothetical protein
MVPPRPTKRSTIMMKTTKSLTFQNLHTSQIKNEEQNSRLSRKQELRRQHTLWNSSHNKMLMKMTMMTMRL